MNNLKIFNNSHYNITVKINNKELMATFIPLLSQVTCSKSTDLRLMIEEVASVPTTLAVTTKYNSLDIHIGSPSVSLFPKGLSPYSVFLNDFHPPAVSSYLPDTPEL